MTWLPAGYVSRPVDPGVDLDAVLSIMSARDLHEVGREDSSPVWLLDSWSDPKFDMSFTLLVTTSASAPAAYAEVSNVDLPDVASVFVRIHPFHMGRGLGGAVLGWTERRAAELPGAERIHHALGAQDAEGRSILEARGYAHVRTFWHMERSLEGPIPDPPAVPVGPMRPGEQTAVHHVMQEAFRGHFGMEVDPFEEWWAAWQSVESLDPSLWLVARDDAGSIVGAALGVADGDVGWVGDLGVLQGHRREGLGKALLLESFRDFKRRGFREARLNVDSENESGAVDLYLAVGMSVRREWAVYEKPLAGA